MTSKFEKKFGKYAINNLSLYLILAYVIGYMISSVNPEIYYFLTFNPYMIFHGQIWRLVTWILIPPQELGFFAIIMLILYYQLGQGLERTWGTYRYNVYMFSGLLFTVGSALVLYIVYMLLAAGGYGFEIAGSNVNAGQILGMAIGSNVSTYYINMSIFLAYAVTYPEEQLLVYFIIPVKMKWFSIIYGAYILFDIIMAFKLYPFIYAMITVVMIAASLLNFLLYFALNRHRNIFNPKQAKRRYQYRQSVNKARPVQYSGGARHKCAVCGRTELDNPELTFRYCSKCSGNKEYCEEHLFTHTHN